jgi:RNA polymerase sigma factor for flagellar operon FliA
VDEQSDHSEQSNHSEQSERSEQDLWHQYQHQKNPQARDELIELYLPLVKRIAERTCYSLARQVSLEDLYSSGLLGLLDAIERYSPSRNIKFSTFSSMRIRGAMLDDVRSNDWVPRTARQAFSQYWEARRRLKHELQREPDDEEMKRALSMEGPAYHKLCQEINLTQLTSFNVLGQHQEDGDSELEFPDLRDAKAKNREELKECLHHAIEELPEKKKNALVMYYHEQMTLKEISQILDVSEGRVSQILSEVTAHLKARHYESLNVFLN